MLPGAPSTISTLASPAAPSAAPVEVQDHPIGVDAPGGPREIIHPRAHATMRVFTRNDRGTSVAQGEVSRASPRRAERPFEETTP